MSRQSLWVALVLIFYAVAGSLYIGSVPLFEASDEAEHFIHLHTILETRSLPVIQSREQMANQTDPVLRWNNQSHHAPLYYVTSALLVGWSQRADLTDYLHPNELIFLRNTVEDNPNKWLHRYGERTSDTHLAIYVLRIANLIIGGATLLVVYGCVQQLTTRRDVPQVTMLFVASIPTFMVVNTSVTNDALVIFLYSAGIYWVLKAWRTAQFSAVDIASISLILAGIALTKLTGVTLFGVVYLALFAGIIRQKWDWQRAAQIIVISGFISALLAGWWYWRNFQLYGDFLAVDATASIWGREESLTFAVFGEDVFRIAKSFWMMIGYLHQPVFVVDAFYIYAAIFTVLGLSGAYLYTIQHKQFEIVAILVFACFVVVAMLLYGTLSVDISYGRLLLPAIAAFAPLLIVGLFHIAGRLTIALLIPFVVTTFAVPLMVVPDAYPALETIETIPESVTPVEWQLGSLEMLAIDVPTNTVNTGDTITVDLYFKGNHPDNPALTVTAVDTIRVQRFDHIENYPGMADMRYLPEDNIYKAQFTLDMTEPDTVRMPRLVNILVEWVDLDTGEKLVFDSGSSLLEIPSATYVDERYEAPQLETVAGIEFGGEITLESYTIPETASAGEQLSLSFVWDAMQDLSTQSEAILALQLLDDEGNLVTQNDGTLWWYPTTAWAKNSPFEDTRTLDIPEDIPAGDYQIAVGWYRAIGDAYPRLAVTGDNVQDNLLRFPLRVEEP